MLTGFFRSTSLHVMKDKLFNWQLNSLDFYVYVDCEMHYYNTKNVLSQPKIRTYLSIKWFGRTESSSMISELWLVGLIFDPGRPLSESENILFLVNNYCLCQQFLFQCQYPIKYWLRRFVECSTSVKWAFRCHNSDSSLTKSDLLVGK